jgi:hypothetical protein
MQRILIPHGLRNVARRLYIDEWSFAYPGTPLGCLEPFALVIHQIWPERKRLALQGLGRVDRTAVRLQKNALDLARNPQSSKILCAVKIALLENSRGHLQIIGQANNILLGQIDEALLFTTFYAAGLALESHGGDG